ncbi:uncharacterized protein LOC144988278 [Oryzias latipes]
MSTPQTAKECDVFTRARKATAQTTKKPAVPENAESSKMANIADVLTELKSLRSEFGLKLDGINSSLGEVTNAITTLEGKVAEVKRDVSVHTKSIKEAEDRVAAAEEELEKVQAGLASATKQLTDLQMKTDDLENRSRRKNLRLFGLKEGSEGTQPLIDFIQEMLPKWLGLGPDRLLVLERAHRTLAAAGPNRHRAVLIRFWKFQDREMVYRLSSQKKIQHDGNNLAFVQDFSAETMRKRREFNTARKLFTDMGIFRGFHVNPCKLRVVHHGKIHLFSSPREAEEFHGELQQKK